jgi:hypothetical protein
VLYSKEKSESEGGVKLLIHNSVGSSVKGKKNTKIGMFSNYVTVQICNGNYDFQSANLQFIVLLFIICENFSFLSVTV